jgi:UDP-GlcNAc3NAcA epimerase
LKRICSIVGARPQFVKLAVICRSIARRSGWTHRIIHTGQHYDREMSGVFFDELELPPPDDNLEVGSGTHGEQIGEMLRRLEPVLARERPDWVLLFGDTNSTLAGAIIASRLGLRCAHVEAGLRSYRRSMPEEANRIVSDHLSDLLLCPTALAIENLAREGLGARSVLTGDVMYDAALIYRAVAERRGGALAERWQSGAFALATVHRAENTDDAERLRNTVLALEEIARTECPVVWPVHPRTRKRLADAGLALDAVTAIDPVSYVDMLLLESRARVVLTDSGGVQKEAYFFQVPCVTLREETEWQETLEHGCNVIAGADRAAIVAAVKAHRPGPWTSHYGNGHAGESILDAIEAATI